MRTLTWVIALLISSAVGGVSVAQSAEVAASPDAPAHAQMTADGLILVTPAGMTLYTFGPDNSTPGKSQCTDVAHAAFSDPTGGFGMIPLPHADTHKSCAKQWPPFLADPYATAGGDWSFISRPDESRQWAYRGHPLYTSTKDHQPGDRNGAVRIGQVGLGGRGWNFAAVPLNLPPGLKLLHREEGLVLATPNDRPIYTPAHARVHNACEACDNLFAPIFAPALANVSGDWSMVNAGAGQRQYAYRRMRLYAAPEDPTDSAIAQTGEWQLVVYRRSPGAPPQIGKHFSLLGEIYTDQSGKTLYAFTCITPAGDGVRCDDPGDAAEYWAMLCGDGKECARRWRPYLAASNARSRGDWSIVEVAYPMFADASASTYPPEVPRVRAWAYRGMPVYTYYEDKAPGDIWGEGIRLFAFSGFYAVQVPGHGLLD
jgi:predicted lipoprotein with Yx(FWY)xxD motif